MLWIESMIDLTKKANKTKCQVPWNSLDILAVLLFTVIFGAVLYLSISFSLNRQEVIFKVFSCSFALSMIFIPYLWLKKRYNIKWSTLGLRIGKYPFILNFILGFVTAFLFLFLLRVIPFLYEVALKDDTIHIRNVFAILLTPFTLTGFTKFALTPFGEEILLRGVVYGYFRKKIGIIFGIFFQAFISTVLHLFYIKEAFYSKDLFSVIIYLISIHIIFSILYEKTNSLYPSIICHGAFNYLLFIY